MNRVLLPVSPPPPSPPAAGARVVALTGPTMGMRWSVKASLAPGADLAALQSRVQALLDRVVLQMSPWEPESALSIFNRADAGAWVACPSELIEVVTASLAWAEASDGAFDPTLGRLVDLWGFGAAGPVVTPPTQATVSEALSQAGWRRLQVDAAGLRLRQPGGLSLDLSGIAKGHAVDEVSRLLAAASVPDHLVEIGGECRGSGVKPNGQPWWVELETYPDAGPAIPPVVAGLYGLSVATSGDYRRFRTEDGVRLSHTIDRRSGRPVSTDVASVSVVHREAMEADVLATIITVLGSTAGLAFAESRGIAARLIVSTGSGYDERLSPVFALMLD